MASAEEGVSAQATSPATRAAVTATTPTARRLRPSVLTVLVLHTPRLSYALPGAPAQGEHPCFIIAPSPASSPFRRRGVPERPRAARDRAPPTAHVRPPAAPSHPARCVEGPAEVVQQILGVLDRSE